MSKRTSNTTAPAAALGEPSRPFSGGIKQAPDERRPRRATAGREPATDRPRIRESPEYSSGIDESTITNNSTSQRETPPAGAVLPEVVAAWHHSAASRSPERSSSREESLTQRRGSWQKDVADEVLSGYMPRGGDDMMMMVSGAIDLEESSPPRRGPAHSNAARPSSARPTTPLGADTPAPATPRSILRQPGSSRRNSGRRISFQSTPRTARTSDDDDDDMNEPSLSFGDPSPRQKQPDSPKQSTNAQYARPTYATAPSDDDEVTYEEHDRRNSSSTPTGQPARQQSRSPDSGDDVHTQPHAHSRDQHHQNEAAGARRRPQWWPSGARRDDDNGDDDPPTEVAVSHTGPRHSGDRREESSLSNSSRDDYDEARKQQDSPHYQRYSPSPNRQVSVHDYAYDGPAPPPLSFATGGTPDYQNTSGNDFFLRDRNSSSSLEASYPPAGPDDYPYGMSGPRAHARSPRRPGEEAPAGGSGSVAVKASPPKRLSPSQRKSPHRVSSTTTTKTASKEPQVFYEPLPAEQRQRISLSFAEDDAPFEGYYPQAESAPTLRLSSSTPERHDPLMEGGQPVLRPRRRSKQLDAEDNKMGVSPKGRRSGGSSRRSSGSVGGGVAADEFLRFEELPSQSSSRMSSRRQSESSTFHSGSQPPRASYGFGESPLSRSPPHRGSGSGGRRRSQSPEEEAARSVRSTASSTVMRKKLVVVRRKKKKSAARSEDDPVVRMSILPISFAREYVRGDDKLEKLIDRVSPRNASLINRSGSADDSESRGDSSERLRFRRALASSVASSRSASRRSSVAPSEPLLPSPDSTRPPSSHRTHTPPPPPSVTHAQEEDEKRSDGGASKTKRRHSHQKKRKTPSPGDSTEGRDSGDVRRKQKQHKDAADLLFDRGVAGITPVNIRMFPQLATHLPDGGQRVGFEEDSYGTYNSADAVHLLPRQHQLGSNATTLDVAGMPVFVASPVVRPYPLSQDSPASFGPRPLRITSEVPHGSQRVIKASGQHREYEEDDSDDYNNHAAGSRRDDTPRMRGSEASGTTILPAPAYAPPIIIDSLSNLSNDWQETLRQSSSKRQRQKQEEYLIASAAAGAAANMAHAAYRLEYVEPEPTKLKRPAVDHKPEALQLKHKKEKAESTPTHARKEKDAVSKRLDVSASEVSTRDSSPNSQRSRDLADPLYRRHSTPRSDSRRNASSSEGSSSSSDDEDEMDNTQPKLQDSDDEKAGMDAKPQGERRSPSPQTPPRNAADEGAVVVPSGAGDRHEKTDDTKDKDKKKSSSRHKKDKDKDKEEDGKRSSRRHRDGSSPRKSEKHRSDKDKRKHSRSRRHSEHRRHSTSSVSPSPFRKSSVDPLPPAPATDAFYVYDPPTEADATRKSKKSRDKSKERKRDRHSKRKHSSKRRHRSRSRSQTPEHKQQQKQKQQDENTTLTALLESSFETQLDALMKKREKEVRRKLRSHSRDKKSRRDKDDDEKEKEKDKKKRKEKKRKEKEKEARRKEEKRERKAQKKLQLEQEAARDGMSDIFASSSQPPSESRSRGFADQFQQRVPNSYYYRSHSNRSPSIGDASASRRSYGVSDAAADRDHSRRAAMHEDISRHSRSMYDSEPRPWRSTPSAADKYRTTSPSASQRYAAAAAAADPYFTGSTTRRMSTHWNDYVREASRHTTPNHSVYNSKRDDHLNNYSTSSYQPARGAAAYPSSAASSHQRSFSNTSRPQYSSNQRRDNNTDYDYRVPSGKSSYFNNNADNNSRKDYFSRGSNGITPPDEDLSPPKFMAPTRGTSLASPNGEYNNNSNPYYGKGSSGGDHLLNTPVRGGRNGEAGRPPPPPPSMPSHSVQRDSVDIKEYILSDGRSAHRFVREMSIIVDELREYGEF